MENKKSHIEIVTLLDELEKDINKKINLYNYYVDVLVDRFPQLGENEAFKRKEVTNEREDKQSRRI